MATLHIELNGKEILYAGGDDYCSLSWDVNCSRYEESFAQLWVSGMIERTEAIYDHAYWLEDFSLAAGDRLEFRCGSGHGTSIVNRLQTHEQLEDLRKECARAEAAGEYDAARSAQRVPLRGACGIGLKTPDGRTREVRASESVMTVLCNGIWSNHHKPNEWRLRLWSMPAKQTAPGFWQPIEGSAHVTIQA